MCSYKNNVLQGFLLDLDKSIKWEKLSSQTLDESCFQSPDPWFFPHCIDKFWSVFLASPCVPQPSRPLCFSIPPPGPMLIRWQQAKVTQTAMQMYLWVSLGTQVLLHDFSHFNISSLNIALPQRSDSNSWEFRHNGWLVCYENVLGKQAGRQQSPKTMLKFQGIGWEMWKMEWAKPGIKSF